MKSLRRYVVGAGAVALATVGASRDAKAAGFAGRIGGEEGTVVSTNPTALYYNPGAMAFAKGSQLGLYGTLAIRHATWTRAASPNDLSPEPDSQVGNYGEATLTNVFGGPQLGGTLKLGNLALGAGFFAPFGGSVHWDHNDTFNSPQPDGKTYPLAAAGVQRWFQTDGFLRVLYFTAGAAYRLGPLAIGATGNFISSTINTTQAKNLNGLGLPDTTSEDRVFVDVHGFDWSFAAGAMLEVVPDQLYLGASYQAQPGLGPQKLSGVLNTLYPTYARTYQVDLSQSLPDIVRGGVRWHMKSAPLEFRLFGDYTRWSKLTAQCTTLQNYPCGVNSDGSGISGPNNTPTGVQAYNQRNFVDTWGARLGVSYWVVPRIELLFGTGYETAAVPDSTLAPDLMDAVNIQGTLGARFALTESLFLSAEYTHIQYMDRNNIGKSITAVDASGNRLSVPTIVEDSGGIYTQWVGIATGNLEALF